MNLSTIDPPDNRIQRTLESIEVENQNLYGSQPNVNPITMGESQDQVYCNKSGIKNRLVLDLLWVAISLEIIMVGVIIVRLITKTYLFLI